MKTSSFEIDYYLLDIGRLESVLRAFFERVIWSDLVGGAELELTNNFKKWHKITIKRDFERVDSNYIVSFSDKHAKQAFFSALTLL